MGCVVFAVLGLGVTVDFENSFPYGHSRVVSRLVPETALILNC